MTHGSPTVSYQHRKQTQSNNDNAHCNNLIQVLLSGILPTVEAKQRTAPPVEGEETVISFIGSDKDEPRKADMIASLIEFLMLRAVCWK